MHARPLFPALVFATAAVAAGSGCGSTPDKPTAGPQGSPCDAADARLRKQLGPELQAVAKRVPVIKPAVGEAPATAIGCAVVYTLVPEELAEEGVAEDSVGGGSDHRLAFLTPDAKTRWSLHIIERSAASPGAVDIELETADLNADGTPEVIVRESSLGADSYQGLRLFSLTASPDGPRDLLSESLRIVTPENVNLFAQWKATAEGGKYKVVFEAGGSFRIFGWNDADKKYQFDEAATFEANPKPAPPPPSDMPPAVPGNGAPASAAPGKIELP